MPYTVGMTGGIGSGKSTVERLFRALSADIIDADGIAHRLTEVQGLGMPAIESQFGNAFISPDGSLNRSAMRERIFSDPGAKRELESILHPLIRAEIDMQLARSAAPYTLLTVPLLIETKAYEDRVARVLVVDCPEEQQVRRTKDRSKLSEAEIRRIMGTQIDRKERIRHADDIIMNCGEITQLAPAVAVLDQRFRTLAASRKRN